VNISIDPTETPALAAAKKRTYLKRYGRRRAAEGWHFLTGDATPVRRLADAVGFHYAYDAGAQQYAHPSGIVILTPEGKISRYFLGVQYPAGALHAALAEAAAGKVGSPVERLWLLCFHFNPITGKYGPLVLALVRVGGVLTLLALAAVLVARTRREGPKRP
jgi:protein SCO1